MRSGWWDVEWYDAVGRTPHNIVTFVERGVVTERLGICFGGGSTPRVDVPIESRLADSTGGCSPVLLAGQISEIACRNILSGSCSLIIQNAGADMNLNQLILSGS